MATVGETIRRARKALNITQERLAEMVGVTRVAVSEWERDISVPRVAKAKMLAVNLGVPEIDLTPLKGAARDPSIVTPLDWTAVPAAIEERRTMDMTVDQDEIQTRFALTITDDSMQPDYEPGDRIEIDTTVTPWDGCQVVAVVEESPTRGVLRHYRQRRGGFDLWPSNVRYRTHTVVDDESAHILGVVVYHGRQIRPPERR